MILVDFISSEGLKILSGGSEFVRSMEENYSATVQDIKSGGVYVLYVLEDYGLYAIPIEEQLALDKFCKSLFARLSQPLNGRK